jgi:hypothetical protein
MTTRVARRKRVSSVNICESSQFINCDVIELQAEVFEADDSFQVAIKRVATFVQFLFLMPVCGASKGDANALSFKWHSLRVLITLCYIGYGVFTTMLFFRFIYNAGIDTGNIGE